MKRDFFTGLGLILGPAALGFVIASLVVVAFAALAGCKAPQILGGPTPATTSHACPGGFRCPNGFDCPPLANPTGPCEAEGAPPEQWGKRPELDAGADVQPPAPEPVFVPPPDDPNLGDPPDGPGEG